MTPVMRLLRIVFFRPLGKAEDQERLLRETELRVDHGNRVLGNSYDRLNASSRKLCDLKESFVSQEYLDAVRQLSGTLDNK